MSQQQFLQQFENKRLEFEGRIVRMPEAAHVLSRYGGPPDGLGQRYLHALPTVVTLIDLLAQAPRTADAFRDRVERAGPTRIRHHEVARAFTCFGMAYLYRSAAKKTGLPELAQQLARMATLAAMTPREMEKVDWVVKSFSHRDSSGRRDRLATPLLLLWWLTGGESTTRAYEATHFLETYAEFVNQSLEHALNHQIYMQFPW